MSKPDPILLITDAMGVYIPRNFATYFGGKAFPGMLPTLG